MAEKEEFKHLVRIANTDIDGNKKIAIGLRKIKGIGFQFANMVCSLSNVDKTKKTGELTDEETNKIEDVIKNPSKYKAPSWMLNRRKDYEDSQDKHLLLSDLKFIQDNDVKRLRKIKSYRGSRHATGRPVRGQRTKGHFRKNIGKVLGVKRKKGRSGRV